MTSHAKTLNFRSIVHFFIQTFSSRSYEFFLVLAIHILGSNLRKITTKLLPVCPNILTKREKNRKKQITATSKLFAWNVNAKLNWAPKRNQHWRTQHWWAWFAFLKSLSIISFQEFGISEKKKRSFKKSFSLWIKLVKQLFLQRERKKINLLEIRFYIKC